MLSERISLSVHCFMNFVMFPFDAQSCQGKSEMKIILNVRIIYNIPFFILKVPYSLTLRRLLLKATLIGCTH